MSSSSHKIFKIKDTTFTSSDEKKDLGLDKKNQLSILPDKKQDEKEKSIPHNTHPSLNSNGSYFLNSHPSYIFPHSQTFHPEEKATVVMEAPIYQAKSHARFQEEHSYLVCLLGPKALIGKSWPLSKPQMSIGRSKRSDICISDPSLSKKHVVIYQDHNNSIWLKDQKSTNGTVINEEILKPGDKCEIKDNFKVRLGKTVLKFLYKNNPEIISIKDNFKKAFQDALTGVGNRQSWDIRAQALFKQSQQYDLPLSLIVFDIDHFKKVNDTYGHLMGDFILKEVVKVVKPCFRSQDLFVRYGGEEFCIMIQSLSQRAKNAIEKARQKVSDHLFRYKDKETKITISAGVADRIKEDQGWKNLYERADKKLYEAKKAGRNRVYTIS